MHKMEYIPGGKAKAFLYSLSFFFFLLGVGGGGGVLIFCKKLK